MHFEKNQSQELGLLKRLIQFWWLYSQLFTKPSMTIPQITMSMVHFFVILFSPLVFYQEVSFQNRFNHEVVFFIPTFKQSFLHNCKLSFINAYQTRFSFSYSHLLSYLQISVEKNLFPQRPTNIHTTNQMLCLL